MATENNCSSSPVEQELMQQCPSCKLSDVEAIVAQLREESTPNLTLRLGDPVACHKTKSTCSLCKFICDVHDIEAITNEQSIDDLLDRPGSKYDLALMFGPISWYTYLDIDSQAPATAVGQLSYEFGSTRSWKPTYVFLEQDERSSDKITPRMHHLQGAATAQVDYSLLRSWLDLCQVKHGLGPCCSNDENDNLGDFYVIDVHSRQVLQPELPVKYAALSYVWGSPVEDFYEECRPSTALPRKLPDTMSQTIADAIIVTRELKLRYLWIDRFCIDQGDSQHVRDQVGKMDKIYAAAQFTIIARDGIDANAGLAGVSRPLLSKQQPRYRTKAGTLVATHLPRPNRALRSDPWNQRAWTMQEHLFSRRRIVFDSHQVIWSCRTEYLHDCLPELDPAADWTFIRNGSWFSFDCDSIDLEIKNSCFSTFSDILSVYTSRRLGNQRDVLKACQCMLSHLTMGTQEEWIFAHPEAHMLPSLLWKPHFRSCAVRHDQFPSWSWLGWQGSLEYSWWLHNVQLNEALDELPKERQRYRPDKYHVDNLVKWRKTWRNSMKTINMTAPTSLEQNKVVASWSISGEELVLETCVTTWAVTMVRSDSDGVTPLLTPSQQSEIAIGDHWTFANGNGQLLENVLGEHTEFETADYFFRTSPEISKQIGKEVRIATISFYEHIVDAKISLLDAKNVVAGLVLLPQPDGKMLRIASVAMPWHFFRHAQGQRARVVIV